MKAIGQLLFIAAVVALLYAIATCVPKDNVQRPDVPAHTMGQPW